MTDPQTEPPAELVEAVARAIVEHAYQANEYAPGDWPAWEGEARAAIRAVRAYDATGCRHLRSAGDPVCLWCGQVEQ